MLSDQRCLTIVASYEAYLLKWISGKPYDTVILMLNSNLFCLMFFYLHFKMMQGKAEMDSSP